MNATQSTPKKRGRPTGAPRVKNLTKISPAPTGAQSTVEPSAGGILRRAAGIMEERGRQYDQPGGERSMGRAVGAFNIITGRNLLESDGWLLLQVLKDVRDRQRDEPHLDSLDDCVAYSALKAEARLAGK